MTLPEHLDWHQGNNLKGEASRMISRTSSRLCNRMSSIPHITNQITRFHRKSSRRGFPTNQIPQVFQICQIKALLIKLPLKASFKMDQQT